MNRHRFVHAIHFVFILQAKRHNLELQHADCPHNQIIITQRHEHLSRSFFGQLGETFLKLFELERVFQPNPFEQFRSEVGNAFEFKNFSGSEGIANLNGAMIV